MGSCIPQHTVRENTHTLLHGVGVEDMHVGEERIGEESRGEDIPFFTFCFLLLFLLVHMFHTVDSLGLQGFSQLSL